jgi:glycyl-tRNA synthetase beta chain
MAHHQRFFPVRGAGGELKCEFVAILDRMDDSSQYARRGFERVLVPRLHDAMFFLGEDQKTPLEARLAKLKTVTYHKKLGTTFDKAKRLTHLAKWIAAALGGNADEQTAAARAGLLAKCDLATFLVGEFPELQGHVGSVYALREGESAEVAEALDLQYVHDFDGRPAPSRVALSLLLAENLDIVAQFGTNVGLPTGSADPFGVRRAAITLLDACERWAPTFDLRGAAAAAARMKPVVPDSGVQRDDALDASAVLGYLDTRLRQRLKDRGVPSDHLDAIESWTTIGAFTARADDLRELAASADFARLLEVAQRCRNITKNATVDAGDVDPAHFRLPAETVLFDAWTNVRATVRDWGTATRDDIAGAAAALAQPLHTYFADVLVNDPDPAVRTNRLRLLLEIDRSLREWADLCKIVSRGA